jgi:hypothetical protein
MDRRPDTHDVPPLACWLLVSMLTIGALLVFAIAGERFETPPSEAFRRFNEPRAERFAAAAGEGLYRVVMLGNSRLKYATWNEKALAGLVPGQQQMAVLRIVNDWAVFTDFEPFIDRLLEQRPDLVVVQLELLTQERSGAAQLRLLRAYLKWRFFGSAGEIWNPGGVDQQELQFATPCAEIPATASAAAARLERTGRWLTHDPMGRSSGAARSFIEKLRRADIDVALLTIPTSSAMERRLPESERLADALSKQELGAVWHYPHTIADSDFCDTIHLDESGRDAYSGWLATKISEHEEATRHSREPVSASIAKR